MKQGHAIRNVTLDPTKCPLRPIFQCVRSQNHDINHLSTTLRFLLIRTRLWLETIWSVGIRVTWRISQKLTCHVPGTNGVNPKCIVSCFAFNPEMNGMATARVVLIAPIILGQLILWICANSFVLLAKFSLIIWSSGDACMHQNGLHFIMCASSKLIKLIDYEPLGLTYWNPTAPEQLTKFLKLFLDKVLSGCSELR